MKIEDNFLDQEEFVKLQNIMMSGGFAWYYTSTIDTEYEFEEWNPTGPISMDKNKFMFTHMFYFRSASCSPHFKDMELIFFEKIDLVSLWRIKANLLTKTSDIVENSFHVDMADMSKEKLKQWTTSIFYMNSNNGYTKFEDGTKVESVANRMITFPSNLKHTGTSCTDEKRRIVINFNYFANRKP